MNAFDVDAMNRRIAERARAAAVEPAVPIKGPLWASRIIDRGHELVAIHGITAVAYPIDLFDLTPEEAAIVIVRRILAAGGTRPEALRLIDALSLPAYASRRIKQRLNEEMTYATT